MIELDANQCAQVLGITRKTWVDKVSKRPDAPKPSSNWSQKVRKWPRDAILRFKEGRR